MQSKFISLAAIFIVLLFPQPVRAKEKARVLDLSSCRALKNEKSYEKSFEGLLYLVQGKDGWIFRTKQDLRSDFTVSYETLRSFQILEKVLKIRGTELVIAVAPTRGMAANEFLPNSNPLVGTYNADEAERNYATFIQEMNVANIHTVGTPAIKSGAGYFYKTDLHWTTEGAREMAEAVASYIKTIPAYASVKKSEFTVIPAPEGFYEGNFSEAIQKLCRVKLPLERASQIIIEAKSNDEDQANALLGEVTTPDIVLVGTSNSKRDDFDMNFSGSLKEFLSADIQNEAIAGGGLDDSIIAYLSSESFKSFPPKILIWEIPGYYDLNGKEAKKSLARIIPAAYGDCDIKALADSGTVEINNANLKLLDAAEITKTYKKPLYLHLKLDKPTQKSISMVLSNADKTKKEIKLSSSRDPDNTTFIYSLGDVKSSVLNNLQLKASKEILGRKVRVRLCAMRKDL